LTRERISLGRAGEETAAVFLKEKGMRIIQRNFRCPLGEIDIVAYDRPFLVFVEVRTVAGRRYGSAQESINKNKKYKLKQVAKYYILAEKVGNIPMRFDVVAVNISPGGGTTAIDHIINAF